MRISSKRHSQTLGKGKVIPVHATKAYGGSGGVAPLIFKLSARFSCQPHALPFTFEEKISCTHWWLEAWTEQ